MWNIATGEKKPVSGHRGSVQAIAFSPDGKRFAASAEQTIYFFTFSGESLDAKLATKIELDNLIKTLAFSPDGKWLAAGERDGKLRLFTASEGASVTSQDAHTNGIYGIAFSPDSQSVATASFDRTIKVWQLED